MSTSTPHKKPVAWAILLFLAIIWGTSFILIKRGLYDSDGNAIYSDVQVAALRMFMAFLCLLPIAIKHLRELVGKHWKGLLISGLFGNGIPAFLFATAQTQLDSSFTGMLNALVPLFTVVLALLFFKARIRWYNGIGIIIGLGGAIGLLTTGGIETLGTDLRYAALVIAATICYAISVNVIKHHLAEVNPIVITSIAFAYIGPPIGIYLLTSNFTEVLTTNEHGWSALGYLAILAVVGTALAVVVFNYLVKMTNQIFASSVTYLIPIVAIFWGVLDGEIVSWWHALWMSIILGGVYLVNKSAKSR